MCPATQYDTHAERLALDEAFAHVAGVIFQNRYNFAQDLRISIRGFGAQIQLRCARHRSWLTVFLKRWPTGKARWTALSLASVRQVEVLRGPASALYGNAAGGVISIQSELGSAEPYADARIAVGDYGYRKYQVKTAGAVGRLDYSRQPF